MIEYYRRYPSPRSRMRIDDESGSMLSALLVLRFELKRCSPRLAATVQSVLPAEIRRGLLRSERGQPDRR